MRETVCAQLGVPAMIDANSVASDLQRMARIADTTGITPGLMGEKTEDLREQLGINRFSSEPQWQNSRAEIHIGKATR